MIFCMNSSFSPEDYYLRAIGKFMTAFSYLEALMAESIREFITDDYELAQCITAKMYFKDTLALLGTLFKYRLSESDSLEQFKALINTLTKLNQKRDDWTHSEWFLPINSSDNAYRRKLTKSPRTGLSIDTEKPDLSALHQFTNDIYDAANELFSIIETNRITIKAHRAKNADRTAEKIMFETMKKVIDNQTPQG